jgi:predicted nucleic acid-binding Zn ribbon protein
MNTLLIIFLVLAMIAVVVSLVRGIIAFLQTTEADLKSDATGPSVSSQRQNKAMMQRVLFQGVAIIIIVVIFAASRG